MDIKLLKDAISDLIENVPVGLCWKMISHSSQGAIPKEQQVKALHVLVDELDIPMAKPLIMALYTNSPSANHQFPLHIQMHLVPEMDAVLNTKGRQNVDKLRACQNTWSSGKLIQIKTWEIELLDDESEELGMTLRDAMMDLCHPTNDKFNLFHSIDKHFCNKCHVLTVLKSAESQAHAMIAAMLPYLLWQHAHSQAGRTKEMVQTCGTPPRRGRLLVPKRPVRKTPVISCWPQHWRTMMHCIGRWKHPNNHRLNANNHKQKKSHSMTLSRP